MTTKTPEPSSVYVELMVHPGQMWRCAECDKLINWPEDVRIYAPRANAVPERFEHTTHPVRFGSRALKGRT